jgi:hypothetical protein
VGLFVIPVYDTLGSFPTSIWTCDLVGRATIAKALIALIDGGGFADGSTWLDLARFVGIPADEELSVKSRNARIEGGDNREGVMLSRALTVAEKAHFVENYLDAVYREGPTLNVPDGSAPVLRDHGQRDQDSATRC